MKRNTSYLRRWLWSLAAGVLLVPLMTVGAIADSQTAVERVDHVKQSRAIGHAHATHHEVEVATHDEAEAEGSAIDRSMTKAEHEEVRVSTCRAFVETDHAPFPTDAEHKAYHGIPTDIDHTDDPVFATAAEHKAYHDLPCGIGGGSHEGIEHGDTAGDEATADDHATRHETDGSDTDDATDDRGTDDDGSESSAELKEQPLGHTDDSSRHDDSSTRHGDDTSRRNQENSEERTN